ncbi:MAG TPA: CapA family protein [Bacteroidia bacterium]|jgi:poly-gamma-glutamate capsule biosynthesis protein CapA/YwtB (metallophosphatase superfamily)|nr:CapA family protein [Bacteroidia bacterium]
MRTPVLILSILVFLLFAFVPEQQHKRPQTWTGPAHKQVKDSIVSVRISFTGDLMCHVPQYENSRKADGIYDFNPSFAVMKPWLEQADITMGNLELTFAGPAVPLAGYPIFNTPDSYADALKNAGFDFVVTANNHCMDTREAGLLRTLDILKAKGIGSTGTFKSQADHDSVRILNIKGIKLGILNYTYGTNEPPPPSERKYEVNIIDTLLIQHDIMQARTQGAELVLVYFHYGKENQSDPNDFQKLMVRKTQEYGADIIIGGHPHVISPVNYYKTKHATLDTGIVAWSLGNFISNQYWRYTDAGLLFSITLRKNMTKGTYLKPIPDYMPTWVYRGTNALMKKHIVFPAELALKDSLPPYLDASARAKMKEALEDTRKMMEKDCPSIQLKSIH